MDWNSFFFFRFWAERRIYWVSQRCILFLFVYVYIRAFLKTNQKYRVTNQNIGVKSRIFYVVSFFFFFNWHEKTIKKSQKHGCFYDVWFTRCVLYNDIKWQLYRSIQVMWFFKKLGCIYTLFIFHHFPLFLKRFVSNIFTWYFFLRPVILLNNYHMKIV